MKQQTSSISGGNDRNSDARNLSTNEMKHEAYLNDFFAELIHLKTSLENQMRNTSKCIECQRITSSVMDCLDLFDSHLTCDDCGEFLFDCGNYEESNIHKTLPKIRLQIRFSCSQRKQRDEEINILKNQIETVNNNIQHLKGEEIRLQNSLQRLSQQCSSLHLNRQQQDASMNELKLNQDRSEQKLLVIQQKMEDLHYATYDGSLVWIINEVTKKMHAAQSGQQTSIYSPIFYSSPNGYKMRVRLDLYGDGHARGTHMSIFLVILKGDYDPILSWPFNFKVVFGLFDQIGQNYHVVDSFYPDTTSASFQRPTSDENIPSGILKFCLLAAIQQQGNCYVQNDTMYIKIMLDFFGTPRPLLPYIMSVNPGLSTHEQEAIRCREMEQYRELRADLVEEINRNNQEVAQRAVIPPRSQVPAPARIRQQSPATTTTTSESISCEDILVDE